MAERQLQQDRGNARLKFLDRYVGIPVVQAVGLWHRMRGRRVVPSRLNTIGLMKTAGIGDTVLLTGVIHDVRVARADARIVLFVSASNAGFGALIDDVDAVVVLPVRNIARAVRVFRAEQCDLVIDFGAWPRFDALLTALSGAACTVGMRSEGQHRDAAYDIVVEHTSAHEIQNYRALSEAAGIPSKSRPRFTRGASADAWDGPPFVVLHLWPGGANFEERSWPVERWRELAQELNDRGYDVVLSGGPGDVPASAAIVDAWQADGIRVRSAAGITPEQTLGLLRQAAGVVSVNTGVMHVAAAVGAPVVAINGPTSGARWGPVGQYTRCVASPMVPDGYLDLGWERDDRYRDCMKVITLSTVLGAFDDLMAEVARRTRGPDREPRT